MQNGQTEKETGSMGGRTGGTKGKRRFYTAVRKLVLPLGCSALLCIARGLKLANHIFQTALPAGFQLYSARETLESRRKEEAFSSFFPSGDSWVVGDWAAAAPVSCSSSRNAGFRLPTAAKAAAMQPVAARLPGLPLSPVSSHPHPTRQPAVFTCRASARPFSFP